MLNDPRVWGTHLKRREVVMDHRQSSARTYPGLDTVSVALWYCSVYVLGKNCNLQSELDFPKNYDIPYVEKTTPRTGFICCKKAGKRARKGNPVGV